MKRLFLILSLWCALATQAATQIRIGTANTDLLLQVGDNNRLYQVYFGKRLLHTSDFAHFDWRVYPGTDGAYAPRGHEVYSTSGNEDLFEPALAVTHADGNMRTYLYYKSHTQKPVQGGTHTAIQLGDDRYPVEVTLHYVAYEQENVIKTWSEIRHREKKPVTLWRYASAMLYLRADDYILTEYHSDWAREGQPAKQPLRFGKKIIDTKLGTRAAMHAEPFFELGIGGDSHETKGDVLLGTIAWTGNFRFTFEVDNVGVLRILPGINPYSSDYKLPAGEVFTTPEFIFTRSYDGIGTASRNLQAWARRHQLKNGMGDRMTLLNNWENTYFNFDQNLIAKLCGEAKDLGVDMFLLDDGWFGNKYPRTNDRAGLGDWEATRDKLPGGIPALVKSAEKAGVKFGIWIEPEMVNPKSELYEQHPDWVIQDAQRKPYYHRHQLVLDLSNPAVQDYVYGVVERIMKENPDVAYFKWDCNSPITNVHSPFLKDKQSHLYVDYVRGLYNVLERVKRNYPDLPMMLCAGGGGRCDYGALSYFTEFWCSDDTDPFERLYIQWSMSKFFPAKSMAAHVTSWNSKTSVKFRTDVASMCKLGFDINLRDIDEKDMQYVRQAVQNFHRLKPVILDGEQYRLISPYETAHMAVNYVSADKRRAVLFGYDLHPRYLAHPPVVRLQGLDPEKLYKVTEINLPTGASSHSQHHDKVYSGDYLMKAGLHILSPWSGTSHVFELNAQ